ncbi:c-type cytochrome biogenesis protein CcmI [Marinobacterium sediminicola]|uniref:Cytochrome c-type biogenesis protein CcmH n=1 Tax=Marinobacterium sediminicola TaxID=518898 RepID=A0ABY1RYJ8_9GAMM|nr:c-type cytochrome biogenesis protein CcmI [Marinobacterium sediminicola]ULG68738.1 c-type cytochrome biogenesis protein CcmI [Marinobacterium sediminicola]SMR73264.1 cytochrome c-type biogenesis protein CcmH [Marinobacterium sediminicola]
MTNLWIGIGVLTLIAIAFMFWPLLRHQRLVRTEVAKRQQQNIDIFRERLAELENERAQGTLADEEFATLKLELERNLLIDAEEQPTQPVKAARVGQAQLVTVTLLALMIPAAALGLYNHLGRADDLAVALNMPAPGEGQPTLEEALAALEQQLENNPENPEGWYLLANTHMNSGNYAAGVQAFEQVLKYLPQEAPQYPSVMGQLAQAMFFANEGLMDERIRTQIDATLALEPNEIAALGLLGIDAYEQQNFTGAIEYWRKALINADGAAAESLRSGILRARDELRAAGQPVPDLPELAEARIILQVSLAPELADRVDPEQTVFIFARPIGGRMPLAAVKRQVKDLPLEIELNDSMAMTPQARLSSQQAVEVSARISQSGQPTPQSGDLQGALSPIATTGNAEPVTLVIDQVVQ